MYFRFCGWVVFSCNGGNRPLSKVTHMFRPVRQVAAPVRHQTMLFGHDHQLVAPASKTAISECILLLKCIVFI